MNPIQYKIESTVGPLYLVASPKGLHGVFFNKQPGKLTRVLRRSDPSERILSETARQISEYFAGKRKKFDIVFNLSGTTFQKDVWKALSKIPFGKTVAYKDIAKSIKNPKAVRAVGSANGKNPACILVPCHRVIAADGSIGGYSGGLLIKKQLLKLEGVNTFK